ncbi:MAG: hypothetical protein ACFB9M_19120 [Myxococcota bacterium]
MNRRLGGLLGLEPGDLRKVAPLVAAYALTLTTLYVLKPARNAIFLDRLGVEQLPWVLLLVAVVGGITTSLYSRTASTLATERLVLTTFAGLFIVLVGFRFMVPLDAPWSVFLFYVFVQVFGLLTTSLIWLWANASFDPREARRTFGLIATGGIAGSIAGGLFTGQIAGLVGTLNLLLIAAGSTLVVLGILVWAPPTRNQPPAQREHAADDIADFRLPHLLAANAGMIAVAAVIVDVQFNDLVARTFVDADRKAAFFGRFFAGMSFFSLLFQMLVTPWLLRQHGVGPALGVLPTAIGAGALGMLAAPDLPFGALAKAADGSFRHSVHKAASEVVFLPVPGSVKRRTKLMIDTFIDTAATGLGALLVLAWTGVIGLTYGSLTPILLLVLATVGLITFRIRTAYVDAFRRAIETRKVDVSSLSTGLDEAAVLSALQVALSSDNPRQVLYGLELASSLRSSALTRTLKKLLGHKSGPIRRRALEALGQPADALPPETLADLAERDPELDVRCEAWVQMVSRDSGDAASRLAKLLDGPDPETALAVLSHLPSSTLAERLLTSDRVEAAARGNVGTQAALAGALASTGQHLDALMVLLESAPFSVRQAAIEGMARSKNPEFVQWLVPALSNRNLRGSVRRALAALGLPAAMAMDRLLDDPQVSLTVKRAAIWVLSEIEEPEAARALVVHLGTLEPILAREAIDALLRIRLRGQTLPQRRPLNGALDVRFDQLELIDQTLQRLGPVTSARCRLFRRALEERRESCVDEVFAMLAMLQPAEGVLDAYHNLHRPGLSRANAIEFLENTLPAGMRGRLIPVLEGHTAERPNSDAVLEQWLHQPDPWLRACAVFAWPDLRGAELAMLPWEDANPLVSETLRHVRRAAPAR